MSKNSTNNIKPQVENDRYAKREISMRLMFNTFEHEHITAAALKTGRTKAALIRHAVVKYCEDLKGE